MVDLLTAAVAGAIGLGLGGGVAYFVFYSRARTQKAVVAAPGKPGRTPTEVTVTTTELDKSRREMRTIMVERDLLSEALMKIYEAENDGRITREEREIISKRYSDQIKDLQSKLKDVELVVEVGELEGLRNELVSLFQGKIENIEGRLEAARQRLGAVAPEAVRKPAAPKVQREAELEKAIEKKAKPEVTESERRRKEIMDDVMGELAKLEQLDIEKKQQEA